MFSASNLSRLVSSLNEPEAKTTKSRFSPQTTLCLVLITVALCLLLIHYMKFTSTFIGLLHWFSGPNLQANPLYRYLHGHGLWELSQHIWWLSWHIIGYVLIPVLLIKYVLKEKIATYGVGWGDTNKYFAWYALLAMPIVLFAFIASFRPDFSGHYPFYQLASRSWSDLLLWELIYIIQFICLEFFFRGFLLHASRPICGIAALFIMIIPYTMIHFPKPWLEASGAIFFGLFLGILALKSRSIWGGAWVHITIAVSMDIFALMQTNRLPKEIWIP